jgi:hypothetical protein
MNLPLPARRERGGNQQPGKAGMAGVTGLPADGIGSALVIFEQSR